MNFDITININVIVNIDNNIPIPPLTSEQQAFQYQRQCEIERGRECFRKLYAIRLLELAGPAAYTKYITKHNLVME